MKRTIIFLILFVPFLCKGQTEFAPVGAEWHFSYDIDTEQPNQNYTNYKVVKDTLIEEQTCRKIEGTLHQKDSTIILQPLFVYNRNDSVFFFNNFLNRFTLLYDFTITPGDTLVIPVPYLSEGFPNDTTVREIIDSIVIKEFQGEELKYFYTRSLDNWSFSGSGGNGIYAEKIGNLNQPFLPSPFVALFFQPVRCYEDSDVSINFFDKACDFVLTTSIGNIENKINVKIYPNPAKLFITLESEELFSQNILVSIYNEMGELQMNWMQLGLSKVIDISSLLPGKYIIRIKIEKDVFVEKLIKI